MKLFVIVWFNKTLKGALNNDASLRKGYNIVNYEKKLKQEQKGIN